MRAALVALIAACSAPPKRAPIEGHAAPAPAPTLSPPRLSFSYHAFAREGLPAITRDGALVVFATSENDAGRGNLNLKLEARTRTDTVDRTITIVTVDESQDMDLESGPTPQLDARISAANTWLADLHRRSDLQPLTALEVDDHDRWTQHLARHGDATIDWQKDHLTITSAGKTLVSRDTPAVWQAHPRAGCTNPSKLGAAWLDLDRRIALIEVDYNGSDTCWEPSPVLHVVAW